MIPPTNDTSPVVIQPDKKIIECIKDDRPHQFLNVKTVQTFEPVTFDLHTAYTVYADAEGGTVLASGWTLRDAKSLFAHIYNYDRATIRIRRPFKRQYHMKQTWFACGCFWGTEHYIRSFEGVVETLTGYAYGDLAEPSYQQVYTDRADVEKVYEEIQVAYGEPLAVEKEPLTQFSSFCIDYKNTKLKYLRAFDAVW